MSVEHCYKLLTSLTLDRKCGEMLVSTYGNFSSIITFAVEHQLDLLFEQYLEFMEVNADKIISALEFTSLPLAMMLAF